MFMQQPSRLMISILFITTLPLVACDNKASKISAAKAAPAATISKSEESGISRITLTDQAAQRIGIQVVQAKSAVNGVEVPYSALLYEAAGNEWVYTNPEPRVFKRVAVKVERIAGDNMYLSKGLKAGTKVVTVGAVELHGAEFEIGH